MKSYNLTFARTLAFLLQIVFYLSCVGSLIMILSLLPDRGGVTKTYWAVNVRLEADPSFYSLSAPALGVDKLELGRLEGEVRIPMERMQPWGTLYLYGAILFSTVLYLWMLWTLWKLFASIANLNPFTQANVFRLRVLGWASLGLWAFSWAVGFGANQIARGLVSGEGSLQLLYITSVNFGLTLSTTNLTGPTIYLVLGLAVLALAEVFRYAIAVQTEREQLRKEQELVI